MVRRNLEVIPVTSTTLPALLDLWLRARIDSGTAPEVATRTHGDSRLASALMRPDVTAHLAVLDEVPVGFCVTSASPFGLAAAAEIAIEQLWVDAEQRRHGVARALLGAVVVAAERAGADLVVSNVPTQSRDANRFFARLGFGSVTVRRVTSAASLRRKLAPETTNSGLQALLTRRRRVRSQAASATRTA